MLKKKNIITFLPPWIFGSSKNDDETPQERENHSSYGRNITDELEYEEVLEKRYQERSHLDDLVDEMDNDNGRPKWLW